MVNVNKHTLSQKQQDQLFSQLNATLGKSNKNEVNAILTDLLGPEEKIMLAKRLGIIILLHEGNSLYKVAKVLKVSTSTIASVKGGLETGRYKNLVAVLHSNKTDYLAILNTIDKILHLGGMLPRYGQRPRNIKS
jgi:uncharacterized protein YerC